MRIGLTYNDVLLEPKFSDIRSRDEVRIGNIIANRHLSLPIISAPMDTVTEDKMAIAMYRNGGVGILHRYNTIERQTMLAKTVLKKRLVEQNCLVGAAIGVSGDYLERTEELVRLGVPIICLDIAHAHHTLTKNALYKLRSEFSSTHFMVGNVATPKAFKELGEWGAHSIKVGIGGGSICSTRIKTGHGIPGLQSVMDCARVKKTSGPLLIADGGIKTSGDIVKALAVGADFVMLGSLLAGTTESPGNILESENGKVKIYQGMASSEAQMKWKGKVSSREGISTTIPFKGSVDIILEELGVGIRSGLSYSGARDIIQFQKNATLMRQTSAGVSEGRTHILEKK